MSFKPSQFIIAGVAGLVTAIAVAYLTLQSRSSPPTAQPLNSATTQPQLETPPPATPSPEITLVQQPNPVVIRPPTEGCKINMAIINDPDPPLNVRSSPQVLEGNVVGQLNNNTFVYVVEEQNGWLKIQDPVTGWIAKNRTESSCPQVVKPIEFLAGGNSAIVRGRIIGGGSHTYKIKASAGQTLTVENRKDIFPALITPDGKLLAGDPYTDAKRKQWTGKLPITGDYLLQLDSNFRGFEYEFLVKLES